jgi:hypothetical protein
VAVAAIGGWKQSAEFLDASESRRDGQIDPSAAPNQSIQRFQLSMQGGCLGGAGGIRSVIAKEIN